MAKPDLQKVYAKPSDGTLYRLDGKLGLKFALENLPEFSDNGAAISGGLVEGQLYRTNTGVLMVVM